MSNSNLYGSIDRRKRQPEEQIRAKDAFDRVYLTQGAVLNGGCPEREKTDIETDSFRSAFAKLNGHDKMEIASCKTALIQRVGMNFGETSANQVLARIGILFAEYARR